MLAADVRFEGWTVEYWQRFLRLWRPRASAEREADRARGGLVLVHDGERALKLLHTARGRLAPPARWPVALADLAATEHASWAFAAHRDALSEVMERLGARARRTDDLSDQGLTVVQIFRELVAEGAVESWPRRLRGLVVPTPSMLRRALDATCADGKCIAIGAFADGELWTACVARRRGHAFDVVAGPYDLGPAMGLLSGDWRRDQRYLCEAIEDSYGELGLGCFAPVDVLRELLVDARPGAWTRAVAVRDVVLSPIPPAIGLAIGFDGARAAFEGVRALTARAGVFDALAPAVRLARQGLARAAQGRDPTSVLGFDPLGVLRALLRRE